MRSGNKAVLILRKNALVATCANRIISQEGRDLLKSEKRTPAKERWALWAVLSIWFAHLLFFTADRESSYLVDPASSHMLVSKIKPCMSKYKQVCTVKLRMAH